MKIAYQYVYRIPDRHGNERFYFWRGKGHPRLRLRDAPGSVAFIRRYEELLSADTQNDVFARPKQRTWRWLCTLYFASPEFLRLKYSTQMLRRRLLDSTCAEVVAPDSTLTFADFPIDRMTSKAIRVLRDRKRQHPHAANNRLKAVRCLFNWAIEAEHTSGNPGRDIALLRARSDGHHSWTLQEIVQFEQRHPVGSKARLALDLLIYTGCRRSDLVKLGPSDVSGGWLRFIQVKTNVLVELPILPALQQTLDASPSGKATFLTTDRGHPYTAPSFGNWFRARCDEAGLWECTAHGLRKASAARAAANGATASQLMAIFGWLNIGEADRYTKGAKRRVLAESAISLLQRPRIA